MPTAATDAPTPEVERLVAEVSEARGLAWRGPIHVTHVSRHELLQRVRGHLAHDVPDGTIALEGLARKLLGAFPPGRDYAGTAFELLRTSLSGYYEPGDATVYVARDLDARTLRETLAHEITHALADQHFGLLARTRYRPSDDDSSTAASALAEGDATSLTFDLLERPRQRLEGAEEARVRQLESSTESDAAPAASGAPAQLRVALTAPYVHGMRFVDALRRRGGWAAVNDAWGSPPTTTEQILHPDKWRAHERAMAVADPAPPTGTPLPKLGSDTYGELGLRLAFGVWMTPESAARSASGWGGDRLSVFGREGGEAALLWRVKFDEARGQSFARRAFQSIVGVAWDLGQVEGMRPDAVCIARTGNGVLAALHDERELFLAVGSVRTSASGWRATMSCQRALMWLDEERARR